MRYTDIPEGAVPLGYKKLITMFNIKTIPHFRWSYASPKSEKWTSKNNEENSMLFIYPKSYRLSDNVFEHLEFALKHEGFNLTILKKTLAAISEDEMVKFIESAPTGKYARILWYLYEQFNNVKLSLPDLKQGTYVNLLDTELYFTAKSKKSSRHRVAENLLGNLSFSPMVRRTALLQDFENKKLDEQAHTLTQKYDPQLLARAMKYLYTKETMSSWEIEKEKPDVPKLTKFVGLLHKADSIGPLNEHILVELQKNIIDNRFALESYREFQNYVGEEPDFDQLIIHYIAPKPENVRNLMEQLILSFEKMVKSEIDPVIVAAVLSFMFVFIHPFEDGNGRVHRFLIHYALAHLKFTPDGIVFPVSVAIARDTKSYDRILEIFSKPLMELITDYKVNEIGEMTVLQKTDDFYRYIDLTIYAEYLYECVDKTITIDFQQELDFLAHYDNIKRLSKEIVDMPDQRLDLFIKCVRQNGGKLSSKKREGFFSMLTQDEIEKLESLINMPNRQF